MYSIHCLLFNAFTVCTLHKLYIHELLYWTLCENSSNSNSKTTKAISTICSVYKIFIIVCVCVNAFENVENMHNAQGFHGEEIEKMITACIVIVILLGIRNAFWWFGLHIIKQYCSTVTWKLASPFLSHWMDEYHISYCKYEKIYTKINSEI